MQILKPTHTQSKKNASSRKISQVEEEKKPFVNFKFDNERKNGTNKKIIVR